MSNMLALLAATGGGAPKQYIDSLFSAYTYTGNGATQTINNGIDLAGKGGMVWVKQRVGGQSHRLFDTTRGNLNHLSTNNIDAQIINPADKDVTAFASAGFSLSSDWYGTNANGSTYVSWTFRNAPKFFHHQQVTKSSGSNATVDLSSLGTVGMVKVKRTDAAGSWYVWHRSLTAGKLLIGETTAAEATLGHITMSGTTLTLVNGVIADGTYHVEAYAHDTSADGLIQCGSFASNAPVAINLGWEAQYVNFKTSVGAVGDWFVVDSSRGLTAEIANSLYLRANTSGVEGANIVIVSNSEGFKYTGNVGTTDIYCAIRRPNKPPTLGTQVYNAIARTGTGAAATVTGVGFAPDLAIGRDRQNAGSTSLKDRLRGSLVGLMTNTTAAENNASNAVTSFDMDGISLGADTTSSCWNANAGFLYLEHFFKRAPGFFDEVCYTGTGVAHTEAHNLKAVPELMITKSRSTAGYGWYSFHKDLGATQYLSLEQTSAAASTINVWNNTAPTESLFTLGAGGTNVSGGTHVAYLFASLAGISKCGSYTGNGTSQNIDCGFTAGARFCLIKRTDAASDWMLADSTRGIIAGSDPRLSLNTTAAEVTTDDWLDPFAAGFTVNQTAASNANVLNGTYIFLAIA